MEKEHKETHIPIARTKTASERVTTWIGSVSSLVIHTTLFAGTFLFIRFGVAADTVLLVLTTVVSLEAIYLSIFIQMSVNRQAESLEDVEEDIDEIQEDIDEIQEDVDEIQEDVKEISEDIDDIQEHDETKEKPTLDNIENMLRKAVEDLERLRNERS